jgi:Helix-turn-helix domain
VSWQASSWALKQRVGDPVLKILLLAAANYADPDGKCWPKVETLAFDSEVSKRTIQRKLVELQDLGLIRVQQRYDQKGKQIESMIFLLMEGEGDMLAPPVGRVTPACHGEGDTTLSPTESLNNQLNKQSTSTSKKKKVGVNDKIEYSEEFETIVWQPYPRRDGSKKKAYDFWNLLNDENRARVVAAIPLFADQMKREGRADDKIPHMTTWLNDRRYETVSAAPAAAAKVAAIDWHKTAKPEQWAKVLVIWRGDNNWRQSWGPEPGKPGCMVPDDLLTESEKHWISQSRVPKSKGPEATSEAAAHGRAAAGAG